MWLSREIFLGVRGVVIVAVGVIGCKKKRTGLGDSGAWREGVFCLMFGEFAWFANMEGMRGLVGGS